jgi:hypothetical protein
MKNYTNNYLPACNVFVSGWLLLQCIPQRFGSIWFIFTWMVVDPDLGVDYLKGSDPSGVFYIPNDSCY